MSAWAAVKSAQNPFRPYSGPWEERAVRDFTLPLPERDLGLTVRDADLFASAPTLPVGQEFAALVRDGAALATANGTDMARAAFVIAPVLLELRRSRGDSFQLFSGLEWEVDRDRGLNGYCDYILTKGPTQHILGAPFVAIVEGKNDLVPPGLGQCIAALYAAQLSNQQAKAPIETVHGVVTTGSAWKFLRLQGSALTIDVPEYYIDNLPKIMGILKEIVESA
jgi:hypothetical protein